MYFSREENGNVLKYKNSNIDIKNKWPSDVRAICFKRYLHIVTPQVFFPVSA